MVNSVLQQTQAWPFLVGRGRHEGYQTLLAPSFLVEHDMYETLSEATPSVPPGVLGRAEVSCPGVGSLALTYTTDGVPTSSSESANRVGQWTDEHGRPLEMLYGVVAQEPLSDTLAISDLRRAREEALEAYRSFLDHEDDYRIRTSQPHSLPRQAPGRPHSDVLATREGGPQRRNPRPGDRHRPDLRPAHAARPHRRPDGALALDRGSRAASTPDRGDTAHRARLRHRSRGSIAVLALVGVIVAAGVGLLGRGSTSSSNVKIISASARPANSDTCASATQVTLQASLRADGRVRIRYRWLPTGNVAAASAITDETVTIRGTSQTITDIRDASAAPYRLIIDEPVSRQSGPVTCRSSQVSTPTSNGSSLTAPF
jgi:hypothetical protein